MSIHSTCRQVRTIGSSTRSAEEPEAGASDSCGLGTRGGTRTRTPFRAEDFESSVSAIPPPGQAKAQRTLSNMGSKFALVTKQTVVLALLLAAVALVRELTLRHHERTLSARRATPTRPTGRTPRNQHRSDNRFKNKFNNNGLNHDLSGKVKLARIS